MKNKKSLYFRVEDITTMPLVEQHLHTDYTDGADSPEKIINLAVKHRFFRIVFSEHVQKKSDWYMEFAKKIKALKNKFRSKLEIVLGIEAKMINHSGEIDCTVEQRSQAELIMGSVHGYLKSAACDYYEFDELDDSRAAKLELEQLLELVKNAERNKVDVIGHPFGKYLEHYKKPVPLKYWKSVIKEITDKDLVFDLNYSYHKEVFPMILPILKKHKTKLNIGSDMHKLADFGKAVTALKKIV